MEPFETFEVDGLTVELHYDEDPSSPKDCDQLGTLVAGPRLAGEYDLAHRETTGTEDEALDRGGMRLLRRYLWTTETAVTVPFTFHQYGGGSDALHVASMDTEDPSGFIMTTPERVRELCGDPAPGELFYKPADFDGTPAEWVEEQLRGELREWARYVEGFVVGIVVKDPAGKELESVWGCYPDDEGDGLGWIREEGRMMAEAEAAALREKTRRVARAWASLYLSRGFAGVAS